MEFRFESATENDWPQIIEWQVELEWVNPSHARQHDVSTARGRDHLRERLVRLRADEGFPNEALVARTFQGELAGYAWVAKTHNDRTGRLEASLLGQFVAPAYRDRGLGAQLLKHAEDWARERGLPCLCLFVGANNTIAQRLYKSLGYEVESLRMAKSLT